MYNLGLGVKTTNPTAIWFEAAEYATSLWRHINFTIMLAMVETTLMGVRYVMADPYGLSGM